MRFRIVLILTISLATLLPGLIATAQDDPAAFPPDITAEIQAEMDDLTATGLPPGMVVWIDAPEYQFAGASGFADLRNEVPMSPEGAFRIGSITKMFTATVIIQLAEDGRADSGRSAGAVAAGRSRSTALWRPDHAAPPADAHVRSV